MADYLIHQVARSAAVGCSDGENLAQPQAVKLMHIKRSLMAVDLVGHQQHVLLRTSQHLCHVLVHSRQTFAGVDHENDHIRLIYSQFNLLFNLLLEDISRIVDIPPGVDHRVILAVPVAVTVMPVACHPAGGVHNGFATAAQAVEKG